MIRIRNKRKNQTVTFIFIKYWTKTQINKSVYKKTPTFEILSADLH